LAKVVKNSTGKPTENVKLGLIFYGRLFGLWKMI